MKDLTGLKFGRLTVLKLDHIKQKYTKKGTKDGRRIYWLCKCECGNYIVVLSENLTSFHTKSCGCLTHVAYHKTHGKKDTRIYHIYTDMKTRCYNSNYKCYKNYGAKGVKVCQDWLDDFMSFYNWATNNGYKDNLTIDRIDVNGNYEPNNCRWADLFVQANNKRNNIKIRYNNKFISISECANLLKLKYATLYARIKKGWNVENFLIDSQV